MDKQRVFTKENKGESVNYEIINQCLIIKLNRDLDHHVAVTLREKSDRMIEKGNIKNVIFDFKNSSFMDSSGIGLIMGRYKRVIFTGGKVAVTNVDKSIDRIFRLSGLYKIIEKYESIKEALHSL